MWDLILRVFCAPAQSDLKKQDGEKAKMTKADSLKVIVQSYYQLDTCIWKLKFNTVNSDLQICRSSRRNLHHKHIHEFCPFHGSREESKRHVNSWTISSLLIPEGGGRVFLVFLPLLPAMFNNHQPGTQETASWVTHIKHLLKQAHPKALSRCVCPGVISINSSFRKSPLSTRV